MLAEPIRVTYVESMVLDFLRRILESRTIDNTAAAGTGARPAPERRASTPFVTSDGTVEVPGNWLLKVTKAGDGWALFIDAPHGEQSVAGVDVALRPILERLTDGAEVPFVCRSLASRPKNIRNMVAVRLGDDLTALERVANQLPDHVVRATPKLVVARFWERSRVDDRAGALADFEVLLAADSRGCANFWKALSPEHQQVTTPALMAWLETRVFGPEDIDDMEAIDDGSEDPSMRHPRFLHVNELYTLPVHVWPPRALRAAQATVARCGSLPFFENITADVLSAEAGRRATKTPPS